LYFAIDAQGLMIRLMFIVRYELFCRKPNNECAKTLAVNALFVPFRTSLQANRRPDKCMSGWSNY
jgi:hypothetical protein